MTPRRVLVCGTPRSGTTLAQRIVLNNLSGAVTAPETHHYAIGPRKVGRQTLAWFGRGRRAGGRYYEQMWERAAAGSPDAALVVEKTPNHLRWLPYFLERDLSLVALVVEKPVDAATASLAQAAYAPSTVARAYAHVRFDRGIVALAQRDHDARVQSLALSELAVDERSAMTAIIRAWGLDVAPAMAVTEAADLVTTTEPWKAESLRRGDPTLVDRSLRAVHPVDRAMLTALAHLHEANVVAGRQVPPLTDTVLIFGRRAPWFLGQLGLITAKHLVVRRLLGRLFLPPRP